MALTPRYLARKDIVDCDIGGDRALMHLDTNTYFTINATASVLWKSMAEPQTLDQLVGVVVHRFDVSAEQCRPDVQALLGQMVDAQLVEVVLGDTVDG